jgi:hypothetical protein
MRRTTDAIVKEHRADRRLMFSILQDHGIRIRDIESHLHLAGRTASTPPDSPEPHEPTAE